MKKYIILGALFTTILSLHAAVGKGKAPARTFAHFSDSEESDDETTEDESTPSVLIGPQITGAQKRTLAERAKKEWFGSEGSGSKRRIFQPDGSRGTSMRMTYLEPLPVEEEAIPFKDAYSALSLAETSGVLFEDTPFGIAIRQEYKSAVKSFIKRCSWVIADKNEHAVLKWQTEALSLAKRLKDVAD